MPYSYIRPGETEPVQVMYHSKELTRAMACTMAGADVGSWEAQNEREAQSKRYKRKFESLGYRIVKVKVVEDKE